MRFFIKRGVENVHFGGNHFQRQRKLAKMFFFSTVTFDFNKVTKKSSSTHKTIESWSTMCPLDHFKVILDFRWKMRKNHFLTEKAEIQEI